MNMYGDLVMDSVPDKVKMLCRTFLEAFPCLLCVWRDRHIRILRGVCLREGDTDI